MSKLAKAKQILAEKGGLSKSAAEYVFWYLSTVELERDLRQRARRTSGGPESMLISVCMTINHQRSLVDEDKITRAQYDEIMKLELEKIKNI